MSDRSDDNVARILAYLEGHHGRAYQAVTAGASPDDVPVQDLCDVIYSLWLAGRADLITRAGAQAFAARIARVRMAGGLNQAAETDPALTVHLTAYVLGSAVLLKSLGFDVASDIVTAPAWRLDLLFDEQLKPRWPAKWSHHSWRVSHWIGGSPSILLSLWRLLPDACRRQNAPELLPVLAASDAIIDPQTGLLKAYRSRALQALFRAAYRIRHDPEVGDVGGIVHLHWINYAADRIPYKATEPLFRRAVALLDRKPFIERTPYCLDFDVVQIVRTAAPTPAHLDGAIQDRMRTFSSDIADFFRTGLTADYGVHRLPGALATQHESALITGDPSVPGLGVAPLDIIKTAGWI